MEQIFQRAGTRLTVENIERQKLNPSVPFEPVKILTCAFRGTCKWYGFFSAFTNREKRNSLVDMLQLQAVHYENWNWRNKKKVEINNKEMAACSHIWFTSYTNQNATRKNYLQRKRGWQHTTFLSVWQKIERRSWKSNPGGRNFGLWFIAGLKFLRMRLKLPTSGLKEQIPKFGTTVERNKKMNETCYLLGCVERRNHSGYFISNDLSER